MRKLVATLLSVALSFYCFMAMAGASPDTGVTLNCVDQPVEKVLKEIEKQSGLNIIYKSETAKKWPVITLKSDGKPASEVIKEIASKIGEPYNINDNIVTIGRETPRRFKGTVSGTVIDANDNQPVIGAIVTVKGSADGVMTDTDGHFSIEVDSDDPVLSVNYVGMKPVATALTASTKMPVSIRMYSDQNLMDEVVVVGYGTTAIKDLTGSVASIGERTLSQLNVPNASQMLQNLAAGVQVSSGTGVPGETVRIRVRGATSLTGSNEPLFVIDGIPVTDSSVLNDIPTSDIKSMDVLKDASAAAIYGSRAANGVVIVTTKRGETNQKAKVSFNYNVTTDKQINNFRILYGDEWRETIRRFARQTLAIDPSNSTATSILAPGSTDLGTANTNWFDLIKQTAIRHNATMSISGGGTSSKYLMSLSIMDQKGMVIGDRLKRYSARISAESSVLRILRFGMNANMTYSDGHSANTSLFTAQGVRPDLSPYLEDGSLDISNSSNPVAALEKRNSTESTMIMGTVYGEVDILKGLRFRTSLSGTYGYSNSETFSPSYLSTRDLNTGTVGNNRNSKTLWDNTLNYNNKFNDTHALDAMVGVSWEKYISKSQSLSGQKYPDDEIFTDIGSAESLTRWSSGYSSTGLFSSFARVNYRLLERYLLTFTCRYDGSSQFGDNNRYGFFPSGAVAWRINQEKFMRDLTFIDDLKLRASVGVTGVQNLGNYSNRDLYTSGTYNGSNTIYHSKVGNHDIRWEKSTQYDLGLDFSILNSRVRGSLSGYWKFTNDLIWSFSFPSSATSGSMDRNIGSVRNAGVEFNVTSRVFSNRDWNLELTLNMAHNRNKVTKLVPEGRTQSAMTEVVQGSGNQVLVEGYPMGVFFGYKHNGIIQSQERVDELNAYAKSKGQTYYYGNTLKPGHLELQDLNEDGIINNNDRTVIASPEADVYGGLIANLSYKDFTLFCNFGYQIGGKKLYNKALQNIPGQLCGLIDYGLNDRWTPENPGAKLPALYLGDGVPVVTDYELFDASFFRLQEVRLTYNLPVKRVVRGSLFVSATNLFTITSYPGTDPATVNSGNYGGNYETSNYPGLRSFSAGLQITL